MKHSMLNLPYGKFWTHHINNSQIRATHDDYCLGCKVTECSVLSFLWDIVFICTPYLLTMFSLFFFYIKILILNKFISFKSWLLLFLQDEGTFQLKSAARETLRDFGSENVMNLGFRDMWSFVTVKRKGQFTVHFCCVCLDLLCRLLMLLLNNIYIPLLE